MQLIEFDIIITEAPCGSLLTHKLAKQQFKKDTLSKKNMPT
jgi:hypothetical protein